MLLLPIVSIFAIQNSPIKVPHLRVSTNHLKPVVELSSPQKLKFLQSKGVKVSSLSNSPFSLTFDPMHLYDASGSNAFIFGGLRSTPNGCIFISADGREMIMMDIIAKGVKSGSKINFLITFYGNAESPLTLHFNDNMTVDVPMGTFVAPFVIQAGGTFETTLTVTDKLNKDKNVTNSIQVQKITIESIGS